MNREDIVRMAREQGLPETDTEGVFIVNTDDLGRMLSAEREECKKLCTWKTGNQFVDEAVAVCYRAIDQRGQA